MSAGARILPLLPLLWGCAAASAPVDTGVTLPAGALRLLEELGPPVISTLDPQTSSKEAWFSVASGGFAYELDAGEGGDVPSGAAHALAYVDAPGDTPHEAVAMGTEPAISPDGAHVAWVAIDPDTLRRSLVVDGETGGATSVLAARTIRALAWVR